MPKSISIFDTTLRDGTQGEGISLSADDKLKIAKKLDDLGVHYIEGGIPGSNMKDIEFFKRVKDLHLHAKITAFGSTRRKTPKRIKTIIFSVYWLQAYPRPRLSANHGISTCILRCKLPLRKISP